jgi:RNA polymerase sigma-70 factor (sigma-E family)
MPGEPPHVGEVESFLAERGERLLRTAIVLAGSRDAGEDLLQTALERLFRNWRKIHGDPEGYLRRTLAHLAVDRWRRRGRWRGSLGLLQAASAGYLPDGTGNVDLRDQLVRLLVQLPPRQRAAIVLRYWEDLTEAEAAEAMGCSVGTVKSATSRGLTRLRELNGIDYAPQGRWP